MLLKKINAVLALLSAILVLDHSIFYTVWMLSRGRIGHSASQLPVILVLLVVIHAVVSIVSAVRAHTNKQAKVRMYNRQNIPTVLQRMSGSSMLLLLVVHFAGRATYFRPVWLHAVLHPVFFVIVLLHTAVSTGKALISLGIGTAKFIKVVNIVMVILCGVVAIASIIGFYLCLFGGVAV